VATKSLTITVNASITLVQQAANNSTIATTTVTVTPGSADVTGHSLVVMTDAQTNGDLISSIAGGGVTTWHLAIDQAGASANSDIWYGTVSSGGSTPITVTMAKNATVDLVQVSEWSAALVLDQTAAAGAGSGTAISAGSITTTSPGELVISTGDVPGGNITQPAPSNSYTQMTQKSVLLLFYDGYAGYLLQTAAGATSTTWTAPASGHWAAVIASFS
jgi:hypothetical protein